LAALVKFSGSRAFDGPCQSVPRQRARSAANANSAGRGALPRRTHDSALQRRQTMRARRSRRSHRRPDWPRLRVPSTQGCRGHPGSPPPQAEAGSRRPANSADLSRPKSMPYNPLLMNSHRFSDSSGAIDIINLFRTSWRNSCRKRRALQASWKGAPSVLEVVRRRCGPKPRILKADDWPRGR
jgi:hypothetical protein